MFMDHFLIDRALDFLLVYCIFRLSLISLGMVLIQLLSLQLLVNNHIPIYQPLRSGLSLTQGQFLAEFNGFEFRAILLLD